MDMEYIGGGVGGWMMDENMCKSKGKLFTKNGMENEQLKMFWG